MSNSKSPEKLAPLVLKAQEGETITLKEDHLTYKLSPEQSGGAFSVIERIVAPQFQSPPEEHTHTREDWACYILEGRIGMLLNGQESLLEKGGFVFVPRGTFFRWWNPDTTAARILTIYTPGVFAEFFKEVFNEISPRTDRLANYENTLKNILAIQDRYGMMRKS